MKKPRLARALLFAGAFVLILGAAAFAQRQRPFFGGFEFEPDVPKVGYDGRFTFARLRFTHGPAGYYYRGEPAWAHGYPTGERNLTRILAEISFVNPRVDDSVVVAMDDPQLFKYPVAYMTEASFWRLTPAETAGLRAYLQKGGFLIFDDFRDDFYRGSGGWPNFEANMAQVIPGARFYDLDASHPILHSFFEINSFDIVPQFYDRGRPVFRALFENNDPTKRIMAIVNFNTDISNFWEFSGTGFTPVDESNQAYKLGVNYVLYGLMH